MNADTDRRQRILDAAVRVFARKGYTDARIREVADEADVAYGLVYHHYGTKDALLRHVLEVHWRAFGEAVEGIVASERPPREQLRCIVDYVFGALGAMPEVVTVLVREYGRTARLDEALAHPEVLRTLQAIRGIFARAQSAGQLRAGHDAFSLTVLFTGSLDAVVTTLAVPMSRDPARERATQRLRGGLIALFNDVFNP